MYDSPARFIVVDIQWYRGCNGTLIPKELATCDNKFRMSHFVFKPFTSFASLNVQEQRTARYVYNHHHHLKWDDGFTLLSEFDDIIKRLCCECDVVYVKGQEKVDIIRTIVNKRVVNLTEAEKIKSGKPSCAFHFSSDCVCALSNVKNLYKFLKEKDCILHI